MSVAEPIEGHIEMPKLDQDMQEGTVADWKVAVGERVKEGQCVVEIESEKVLAEVVAPISGVVSSIEVTNGAVVPIGTILGRIQANDGA